MGQTDRQTHMWDRQTHIWDRQTHIWDRQTDTHMGQTHTHMKNSLHAKKFFVCGPISVQIVLKHPPWPGDSKSVLRFRIGQWKVGYFCGQTDIHTNKHLPL